MHDDAAVRGSRPDPRAWLRLSLLAVLIGLAAGIGAALLLALINGITQLAFEGRLSLEPVEGAIRAAAWRIVLVPLVGAFVVGLMARWGSSAIRGHGIPEVMERILVAGSRIPARLTILKPLSAAITIGSGGPFGAEGPIIATGGALGSLLGQVLRVTDQERKVLLAAGAAAGMAATFDAPVSAVLLAVELLLFEYRVTSIVPVALSVAAATALRLALLGDGPIFLMPPVPHPDAAALVSYAAVGALVGFVAVVITKALHGLEALYERLPVHWMWWPMLGAVAVGALGLIEPRILGVGYGNIGDILANRLDLSLVAVLVACKLVAWLIYLASGTSGGTLAPLFTFGSGLGALLGAAVMAMAPSTGLSLPTAALVGMAAMFAGASRALLTSVVFAFEVTRQPQGLLPLLAGCTSAVLLSRLLSPHTIMTEKLAQRGTIVPEEYGADPLALIPVGQAMTREVEALDAEVTVAEALADLSVNRSIGHQAFPVITAAGAVLGVVTRRDLLSALSEARIREVVARPPIVITPERTLRAAADAMVRARVGRLPVVDGEREMRLVGILTRSDLLLAHDARLRALEDRRRDVKLERLIRIGRRGLPERRA